MLHPHTRRSSNIVVLQAKAGREPICWVAREQRQLCPITDPSRSQRPQMADARPVGSGRPRAITGIAPKICLILSVTRPALVGSPSQSAASQWLRVAGEWPRVALAVDSQHLAPCCVEPLRCRIPHLAHTHSHRLRALLLAALLFFFFPSRPPRLSPQPPQTGPFISPTVP